MSRPNILLEKSIASCISAIEIYNKPDFRYREETFSILIINAWELLLKAKIIKDNKNDVKSIYVKLPKQLKNGIKSTKQTVPKKTRSGNPMTIEITRAIELIEKNPHNKITPALKENIISLLEIRDNAIHFKNSESALSKIVLELGTASLKNYLTAIKNWFKRDLSKYNFFLMPMSFFHEHDTIKSFSTRNTSGSAKKIIKYIADKSALYPSKSENDYNLLLKLETKFVKAETEAMLTVKTVAKKEDAENPDQVAEIILTEENISQKYPWRYEDLLGRMKQRYSNFKLNEKFHKFRKPLENNPKFCHRRKLYPNNDKSQVAKFYNPNILSEFDKHYTKKK
ncbi:DUF3644 domain-containing protein [Chitinophaga pendula]|uniref:DUF3644 domain-containing protein n=1 Tax=Chitinophaga TaxID=79328 RepID=UPI000BB07A1B|nr:MULTISPECIES: DUF3644 domain-containing protein [Chitinophaga]ASZ13709.1 hypothetical protein CK934_23500 [Chitinophaga sp. MD30]UCJ08674.1 DUF3644 domain-containing protein [Chitinophaga pendula]